MARTPKIVEDRREQLIDAALRAFAQKGFNRTTNKDIAREAGVTPGLIYHYFKSKEALLQAIIELRSPVQLIHSLPQSVLDLSVEKFLSIILQRVLSLVEDELFVQFIQVFLPEILHNPELAVFSFSALNQVVEFVEKNLQLRVERGELSPINPVLVTQSLVGCMMGFVLRRQILHDPTVTQYSQAEIINTIVTTVLTGILPR